MGNRKRAGVIEGVEKQERVCYTAKSAVGEFNDHLVNVKGDEDEQDKTFH